MLGSVEKIGLYTKNHRVKMMDAQEFNDLQARLDLRYVKRDDCESNREAIQMGLHSDDKRLAVIEQQQKVNNWLTLLIASGIVALVIKVFMGG